MSRRPKKPAAGQPAAPVPAPLARAVGPAEVGDGARGAPASRPGRPMGRTGSDPRRPSGARPRRRSKPGRRRRRPTCSSNSADYVPSCCCRRTSSRRSRPTATGCARRRAAWAWQAEKLRKDLERARRADPEETDRLKERVAELERENGQLAEKVVGLEAERRTSEARLGEVLVVVFPWRGSCWTARSSVVRCCCARRRCATSATSTPAGPSAARRWRVSPASASCTSAAPRANGRLYYRHGKSGKCQVLLGLKYSDQGQRGDLEKLRRSP